MPRVLVVILMTAALIACGGSGDDDDGSGTSGGSEAPATRGGSSSGDGTEATRTTEGVDGLTPTSSSGSGPAEGEPTPEDPDFPDVTVTLEVGATAEVDTGDDAFTQKKGRARFTIDTITDPATPTGIAFQPRANHRVVLFEITVESIGEGAIPLSEFSLTTKDGTVYDWVAGTGLGSEILFFELTPGETHSGIVAFEIPEGAEIAWFVIDPSIYVGRNVVFLAE